MTNTRKKYSQEYKEMIVSLVNGGQSSAEVSREYKLSSGMVSRWVRENNGTDRPSFTGHGNERLTEQEKRIKELEKAYLDIKMERDILKKAVGIFSKSDGTNTNS